MGYSQSKLMPISIQPVEPGDLDAIIEIVIAAFPFDNQFAYRYPYRKEYPEDHLKYTKLYYSKYLQATFAGQNTIMVADAPDLKDPIKTRVIAMSIWDNPGHEPPKDSLQPVKPPQNHPEQRDCNPKHLEAYSRATMAARKKYFVDHFSQRQLSLRQLATLPEYWSNGAGTKLLL